MMRQHQHFPRSSKGRIDGSSSVFLARRAKDARPLAMIHLLDEYARKQNLAAEAGFSPKLVRWAICCDSNGRYTGLVPLGDVDAKNNRGREFPRCPDLSQGEMIGGGLARSHFLADTADVVLLYSKKGDEPKLAKHEFFASSCDRRL
jgi:hypothetical protein